MAEHHGTVMFIKDPPIYLTVDYSGINDEPSLQDADVMRLEPHSTQHEITESLDDTEQLLESSRCERLHVRLPQR